METDEIAEEITATDEEIDEDEKKRRHDEKPMRGTFLTVHISPTTHVDKIQSQLESLLKYKSKDKDIARRKITTGLVRVVTDKLCDKFTSNGSYIPPDGLSVFAYVQNNGKYFYEVRTSVVPSRRLVVYMGNKFASYE
jgi:hypothetical protein